MIKHIITWNLKPCKPEEAKANALKVKTELEALKENISEILSMEVHINPLPSGNRDILLESEFKSVEALDAYQVHPEHQRVSKIVGSVLTDRACFDYEF